jgi:Protein of unknown function (DUF1761)
MQPVIPLNYWAILVAVIATMVLGFLWYGPILGKAWMKEMGVPADSKPDPKLMRRGLILMLVGSILTVFVLAHVGAVWRPSVWKAGADASAAYYGFSAGFWTWIGFYVPLLLSGVAWEKKSWKLFWINASYYFVMLQVVAMILAYWR